MSITGNGHLPDHSSATTSDSDADADADLPAADYSPISNAPSDSGSDSDSDPHATTYHHLSAAIGNNISALDLACGEEDEEEEEAADEAAAEAAVARAFSEDERRRRAPLPEGAAVRIVDAMRRVAFPGAPPSWAGRVPEAQWLDRLRRLRSAGEPN